MTETYTNAVSDPTESPGLRRFAMHGVVFLAIQCALALGVFLLYPTEPDDYLGAFDGKTRLLASEGPSRIVFVGGSNVAFGMNCETLETLVGRPIINMGVHAGIGLNVMFEQALSEVRAGDLVVLSPEYEHFDRRLGEELWPLLVEHSPGTIRWLSLDDFAALADNARHYAAGVLRRTAFSVLGRHTGPRAPYTASSFDERGCIREDTLTSPVNVRHKQYFGGSYSGQRLSWGHDAVERFRAALAAKRVALVVAAPPTLLEAYESAKEAVDGIFNELMFSTSMGKIEFIALPETTAIGAQLFYDTEYHLNAAGRAHHTQVLSERIKVFEQRMKLGEVY